MSIINCVLTGDISSGSETLEGNVTPGRIVVVQPADVEYETGYLYGTNDDYLDIPVSKKCSSVILLNPVEGNLISVAPYYRVVEIVDVNDIHRTVVRNTAQAITVYEFEDTSFKTEVTYEDAKIHIQIQDNTPGTYRFAQNTYYKFIAW